MPSFTTWITWIEPLSLVAALRRASLLKTSLKLSVHSHNLMMPTRTTDTSDERWKVYTDVTIDVAMLQEVHANEGSDNVAVVHYSKMWTMIGKFLANGDQVRRQLSY